MSLIIQHNISALNTQRTLAVSSRALSKSLERLSSGFRINVGADGPADLIISEQLRAQNIGLQRAVRNTQEAMNVIGIAEGALNEMNSILKQMRALALHAANSGITSPSQVAADQSELDSGIQTIDRIANTTKFSDQYLLNGGKSIVFDRSTLILGTQQNSLLNLGLTRLDQIFKRDNFDINLSFAGTANPDAVTGVGDADISRETRKAYFEVDSNNAGNDVSGAGVLTASQSFIITGDKGSRSFNFETGTTVGQIAAAIRNVADSTGVDASLIFGGNQFSNATVTNAGAATLGGAAVRAAGDAALFNNRNDAGALVVTTLGASATGVSVGKNTDGLGRIFIKITGDASYELYKDASLSQESLVGHGTEGTALVADNNSGLGAFVITDILDGQAGHVSVLTVDGIEGANGVNYTGSAVTGGAANSFDSDLTLLSGVQLGQNTDAEGKIYIKVVMDGAATGQVLAYKDARMRAEDLVAQSQTGVALGATNTILLDEVMNADGTAGTGLSIALSTAGATGFAGAAGDEFTVTTSFTNLGVRIASQDYGADEFVRIQQFQGSIFQYYESADSSTGTLVDAGVNGVTVQQNGQNALLTVNGSRIETNGLVALVATQDIQGEFVFDAGRVGSTTIAQVGYTEGTVYSRAGLLTEVESDEAGAAGTLAYLNDRGAYLTNAGHVTTEVLSDFISGMQFQLGEGAGDQERTIFSIRSMAVANLGLTTFTERFESNSAVISTRTLSMQDVLGGGIASLGTDPIKALAIIDQAIKDVSSLRARLGAFQKNMLQTNANSLQVAIENIQKTESLIRDANMAVETTEFTKNQILVSAGTAMLAQANVISQNVLQLLG